MTTKKTSARDRKRKKIRATIKGSAEKPRLAVFKSNTSIYAQVIDDKKGLTLASARGVDAAKVGNEVAKMALTKKIVTVVFDRGGYVYTGKVRVLADAARAAGLKF